MIELKYNQTKQAKHVPTHHDERIAELRYEIESLKDYIAQLEGIKPAPSNVEQNVIDRFRKEVGDLDHYIDGLLRDIEHMEMEIQALLKPNNPVYT